MAEFEIERDDSFTVITNNILRNKNLSLRAKGLLCTMLSLPPEWDYSFNGLVAICSEGRDAVRSIINELKQAKYIKIRQYRVDKGRFKYKYTVYRKPYEEREKNENSPTPDFPYTDKRTTDGPTTVNPTQLNTNILNTNKLNDNNDNIDKTSVPEHHYLTKELFKLNYIDSLDSSSYLFDDLFNKYLSNGYTFGEIISSIHYIVPRVVNRKFKDEDGKEIKNKYGYFKNSFESNISKFNNMPDELYPELDEDDYEL